MAANGSGDDPFAQFSLAALLEVGHKSKKKPLRSVPSFATSQLNLRSRIAESVNADAQDDFQEEAIGDDTSDFDSNSERGPEEGVKRSVVNEPPRPRNITQRRRANQAVLDTFLEKHGDQLRKECELKNLGGRTSSQPQAGLQVQKIINDPRSYQQELFEEARQRNVIAVLDTGSGKTLIAALLVQWILEQEVELRAQGKQRQIAFFLVDKVALANQQHQVLSCNLDHPVAKFYGAQADSMWKSKDNWDEVFAENMAVVCTAEILHKCLHHSYIRMEEINLLVFDECHHAKLNHPYARIMKDFYSATAEENRPRILGMTASPVDSKQDPRRAAAQLESLLQSQILTAKDPEALRQTVCKPKTEVLKYYGRLSRPYQTQLSRELSRLLGHNTNFKPLFAFAKAASAQLGRWMVDRFWQLHFARSDVKKMKAKTEQAYRDRAMVPGTAQDSHELRSFDYRLRDLDEGMLAPPLNLQVEQIVKAHQLVADFVLAEPELREEYLSTKVMKLIELLQDHVKKSREKTRCIVFVEQRNTAMMLLELLQHRSMAIAGLKVGVLMGSGNGCDWGSNATMRQQLATLVRFRNGEINCIVATSVAEEGIDIPDCNFIIRFDLYKTVIQYVQSRGRARHSESEYIHMLEYDNHEHKRLVQLIGQSERVFRDFCQQMPQDRRLTGYEYDMAAHCHKEMDWKKHTVPSTGATLTYNMSLQCLESFVATLPRPAETTLSIQWTCVRAVNGFRFQVQMPQGSPIGTAVGEVHSTKAVAKCSAAFAMCLELLQGKHLDDFLRPAFVRELRPTRKTRLAMSERKKHEYDMVLKPKIWSILGDADELFATALTLSDPDAAGRKSQPLLLLTRTSLPRLPPCPLFYGSGRMSDLRMVPLPRPLRMQNETSLKLTAFTLRIFKHIFSKEYDASAAELPYFFAPLCQEHDSDLSAVHDVGDMIDWAALDFVQSHDSLEYHFGEPDDFFMDKFVWDPFDGSRKFFLCGRRHDLKPTDPVPGHVGPPGHRDWFKGEEQNILQWSLSAWSRARSTFELRKDQAVVEAELMPIRRNFLDEATADSSNQPIQCFLILEPLRISSLSSKTAAMAYNLPAALFRLESTLIALEACELLGLDIQPGLALEAVTKESGKTDMSGADQVGFQGGMGPNYERLELLGDCFLKMATTVSIFTLAPHNGDYESHMARELLICNRNLFNKALKTGLEKYIRSRGLERPSWYPKGLRLTRGKQHNAKPRHVLADKSIADVCEAIIGAAYISARNAGPARFDMAVQAVSAVVQDDQHTMKTWAEYYAAYEKPLWQIEAATAVELDIATRVARRLGYTFRHPRLLRCAFMHPSVPHLAYYRIPSYQRLEHLGDALHDMVCVDYLFTRYPDKDPQWLTEHKMVMVGNQFLAVLAVELGFHRSIHLFHAQLLAAIKAYVSEIEAALQQAKDDAVARGQPESAYSRDYFVPHQHVPKCLGDVVEAYIGAIFVDSEYDFSTVQNFFDRFVQPYFADVSIFDHDVSDQAVTQLSKRLQIGLRCQNWELLAKEYEDDSEDPMTPALGAAPKFICVFIVHGSVVARAWAASVRYAKLAAAKRALALLEPLDHDAFRTEYQCDCVVKDEDLEPCLRPS